MPLECAGMASETYLVFGDESGTADLRDDPYFPVFVVAMCMFEEEAYRDVVVPMFEELKLRHFGRRDVVLHERDIRRREKEFAALGDGPRRAAFFEDLTDVMRAAPAEIAAVAIDKRSHGSHLPEIFDPYPLCAEIGLDLVLNEARGRNAQLERIIFESRGKREDAELRDEVASYLRVAYRTLDTHPVLEFAKKDAGLAGTEMADLVAYPIAREVMGRRMPNLPFEVVEEKFLGSGAGERGLVAIPR